MAEWSPDTFRSRENREKKITQGTGIIVPSVQSTEVYYSILRLKFEGHFVDRINSNRERERGRKWVVYSYRLPMEIGIGYQSWISRQWTYQAQKSRMSCPGHKTW